MIRLLSALVALSNLTTVYCQKPDTVKTFIHYSRGFAYWQVTLFPDNKFSFSQASGMDSDTPFANIFMEGDYLLSDSSIILWCYRTETTDTKRLFKLIPGISIQILKTKENVIIPPFMKPNGNNKTICGDFFLGDGLTSTSLQLKPGNNYVYGMSGCTGRMWLEKGKWQKRGNIVTFHPPKESCMTFTNTQTGILLSDNIIALKDIHYPGFESDGFVHETYWMFVRE